MKGLAGVVILISVQLALGSERFSYEGYKTYHVTPKSKAEADVIHQLENNPKYDFWLEPRTLNRPATVMVTPDEQASFEQLMKKHNIDVSVLIENVESTIPKHEASRSSGFKLGDVSFERYLNHTEINAYLNQLALNYPNLCKLEQLGLSYEGRNLEALRISSGGENKPAIFIDAGIHAREWIAPSTALFLIYQLVENASNYQYIEDIDWIILPVLNPDGYEHSLHTQAMWRKTRSPTTDASCPGVDGNRNFDYYWMTIGASDQPCAETYAGPQPNSEPETVILENYLQTHKGTIKLYLSFHSYGRYLLYPWGYTTAPPNHEAELYTLGIAVAGAIYDYSGTNYTIGSSSSALYPTSGSSKDYAAGEAGIELAFVIELPEGGSTGFHPPVERILPIGMETAAGVITFWKYIVEKFVT